MVCYYTIIPAQVRGGSRDDPESERGAVPGIRVVTGFLDVAPDEWAGGQHRGGAPKGAINLSAPDGAPLPLIGGKEKRTKGWPGTQFHRVAERWLRGLIDN